MTCTCSCRKLMATLWLCVVAALVAPALAQVTVMDFTAALTSLGTNTGQAGLCTGQRIGYVITTSATAYNLTRIDTSVFGSSGTPSAVNFLIEVWSTTGATALSASPLILRLRSAQHWPIQVQVSRALFLYPPLSFLRVGSMRLRSVLKPRAHRPPLRFIAQRHLPRQW